MDIIDSLLIPDHSNADQVVFPPLDRSAGCLPSLIISSNGLKHSYQNDAVVVQMGSLAVDSIEMLEIFSAIYWNLWTTKPLLRTVDHQFYDFGSDGCA